MEGGGVRKVHPLAAGALGVLGVSLLAAASYLSARLAWADAAYREATRSSLERAIRLSPDNAEYRIPLASILAAQGDDAEAVRLLRQAAALDPFDSRIWTALALLSESREDNREAEQYLLRASRLNRMFDPRWALANFYYRRGDAAHFWHWARQAADITYQDDDLSDFFRLCLALDDNAKFILDRVIPDRTSVQQRYLRFLLDRHRTADAKAVAEVLLPKSGPAQTPDLLQYCDDLIAAHETDAALKTWNTLAARALIQAPRLTPDNGSSLTNGDFAFPIMNHCFDWSVPVWSGVSTRQLAHPARLELRFSGKQPERIEPLLAQFLPVTSLRAYRFAFEYRTSGIAFSTGAWWSIADPLSGAVLQSAAPLQPADQWVSQEVPFRSPQVLGLVRLLLSYRREPGTTRIAGSISFRNLVLKLDRP